MDIIKANINDLPAILDIQYLAYQSEAELYNDYGIPPLTQTLSELEEESKTSLILKALLNEEIVGSVRAYSSEGTCYIGRLIVHPSHQGKGIGKRLLSEAESNFSMASRYELFTGTRSKNNLMLYEKCGYHQFKEDELVEDVTIAFLQKWQVGEN